ncbi:MAG: hypothetical protein KDC95_09360 [Planctomycetes bacterium]|nr:hypothetical protein [Planctomycetota bacterium]
MATWDVQQQRYRWSSDDRDPVRYCFVEAPQNSDHPARSFTEAEKKAARHAIEEWNEALKRFAVSKGASDRERIVEGEPCDITLRWEDDSFFRDYRVRNASGDVTHGDDLTGSAGYSDRIGGGSLEEVEGRPGTPYTPGRDLTAFPRSEIYFNLNATAAISDFSGWFVDPTPETDEEFEEVESDTIPAYRQLVARPDGPADNRIDFYTVVKHEFGHMLGFDHDGHAGANGDRGQVMAGGVGAQERRHQVPVQDLHAWAVGARRHLNEHDMRRLEVHYAGAFGPEDGRSRLVRTLFVILLLAIVAALVFVFAI